MNRPPNPIEVLKLPVYVNWFYDNLDAMQEALTAEWLIEQGTMPDPTEFDCDGGDVFYWGEIVKTLEWVCEDKTK